MFYKYQVSYWLDGELMDECGIAFGKSFTELSEHLAHWYGDTYISSIDISALDLDTDCPVLPIKNKVLLDQVVEAVEIV